MVPAVALSGSGIGKGEGTENIPIRSLSSLFGPRAVCNIFRGHIICIICSKQGKQGRRMKRGARLRESTFGPGGAAQLLEGSNVF